MSDLMQRIKGSYTIAFTSFQEDGSVDYEEFAKELDYLSKTGAEGVVLYGMTSEYHKLTDAEKTELTQVFLDTLKGRKVVSVLSVTDWSTDVAVKTAQKYQALGVDMLMVMPPFYFSPSVEEVRRHMICILEAVDIPVLIQYAPLATKLYLPEEELVAMSDKYPHAAFKMEYRPAQDFMQKFLDLKPDMPILTGWAGLEIVELYKIGVRGVMTVGGFTELYAAIFKELDAGNEEKAKEIYGKMEKYLGDWMINPESLLAIEKEILKRRGILKSSYCRRPAYHVTEKNSREIDEFLAEFAEYL